MLVSASSARHEHPGSFEVFYHPLSYGREQPTPFYIYLHCRFRFPLLTLSRGIDNKRLTVSHKCHYPYGSADVEANARHFLDNRRLKRRGSF